MIPRPRLLALIIVRATTNRRSRIRFRFGLCCRALRSKLALVPHARLSAAIPHAHNTRSRFVSRSYNYNLVSMFLFLYYPVHPANPVSSILHLNLRARKKPSLRTASF